MNKQLTVKERDRMVLLLISNCNVNEVHELTTLIKKDWQCNTSNKQEQVQAKVELLYANLITSESYFTRRSKEFPNDNAIKLHRDHLVKLQELVKDILDTMNSNNIKSKDEEEPVVDATKWDERPFLNDDIEEFGIQDFLDSDT